MIGKITSPETTFVLSCKPLSTSADSDIVTREIDDAVRCLGIARDKFCLLLSDAARYMTTAGNLLKKLYPKLFRVTCMAHLIHNCAMEVRGNFPAVDELIVRVKALTVKNKVRRILFNVMGQPPQPVITRWTSWLNAALYYSKYLPKVNAIVENLNESGILVKRAKEASKPHNLSAQLLQIEEQYSDLANVVQKMESSHYIIGKAFQDVMFLDFGADVCGIGKYIQRRIVKNDITSIVKMEREDISPHLYNLLQKSQATSASVERSFSILGKILAKDQNFLEGHVKQLVKYNFPHQAEESVSIISK